MERSALPYLYGNHVFGGFGVALHFALYLLYKFVDTNTRRGVASGVVR